jgi:hypothetical protein
MRFPKFFIVGAARAGTTSLWQYLNQHPAIFMPADIAYKEPAFFADLYGMKDLETYLSLFTDAEPQQVIGEASTAYLSAPESPGRISSEIPNAKIIIILRNPTERAYSLYNWMAKNGYEPISTFEKALAVEEKRINAPDFKFNNPENFYNYLYFHSGLYSAQIASYRQYFHREQILILKFDAFCRDTLRTTQDVYRFLDVDSTFEPVLQIHNPSGRVFSSSLQFRLRHFFENKLPVVPHRVRISLMRWLMALNSSSRPPDPIREGTEQWLRARYTEDILRTSEMIGLDLRGWLMHEKA